MDSITEEDIQEDFSIVFDCGSELPRCPLMKKFPTDTKIFEAFDDISKYTNTMFFIWDLNQNIITPCVKTDVSFDIDKFIKGYRAIHDKIMTYMKYQLQNAGIYETLKTVNNQIVLVVNTRISAYDGVDDFHSDSSIFAIINYNNEDTPVFGTEFVYNLETVDKQISFLEDNAEWVLNGNISETLFNLSNSLNDIEQSRIQRFIFNSGDTFMFFDLSMAHSSPFNISEGQSTISIKIPRSSSYTLKDVPITVCMHRKTIPEEVLTKRQLITIGATVAQLDDLGFNFIELNDFRFSMSEDVPIPLPLKEIVLRSNSDGVAVEGDDSVESFFRLLNSGTEEGMCISLPNGLNLRSRGGGGGGGIKRKRKTRKLFKKRNRKRCIKSKRKRKHNLKKIKKNGF